MHISRTSRIVAVGVTTLLASLLTSCATSTSDSSATDPQTADDLQHIHGLAVDPATDDLYAATHRGVFKIEDGTAKLVGKGRQDTMAFTAIGATTFLASGHPVPGQDAVPHLGLIESTNGARTWTTVSLEGEADFHVLEPTADRLYGYDSQSGALMSTVDRRTWKTLARAQVLDLAADPTEPGHLLATTPEGIVRFKAGAESDVVSRSPGIALIDWPTAGTVVGVKPDGHVLTSNDQARTWQATGSLDGQVQALEATPNGWYVATSNGILTSTDEGATWKTVLELAS